MARVQATARVRDRLGWIAAPAHGLDELGAEPQQATLRCTTGQREREQPAGDVRGLLPDFVLDQLMERLGRVK